jgi:hypothetical protein
VAKGQGKPGQQAPWILADFTDQDAAIATQWVNAHPRGFNSPTAQQGQTTVAPGHQVDYQAQAAAQALEQQRQAQALQQSYQNAQAAGQLPTQGGYVNTSTGEITNQPAAAPPAQAGAVNIDTVRTLLGLAVPDDQIIANTGATQEQINAIRNLPVS